MPRVPVGRQSGSPPRGAVYRVSLGDDWDRLNAIDQHALSTKLGDGSQTDAFRVETVIAYSTLGLTAPPSQLTTGETTTTNISGDDKSGGQQEMSVSAAAYYAMKEEQVRDVEVATSTTAPTSSTAYLDDLSAAAAIAEHQSLRTTTTTPTTDPAPTRIVYRTPTRPPTSGEQEGWM